MAKMPAFQFYPGDWLKDPALRAASSGARGLWIDMLCLMWESQPRGYLQTPTGAPLTDEQIARMTGNCSLEEVRGWLAELESLGVFSRTSSGVIYSRRLVREERKRVLCREAGKRGGNPALIAPTTRTVKGEAKGRTKGQSKGEANPNPTPSSSSSSSTSTSCIGEPLPNQESISSVKPQGSGESGLYDCGETKFCSEIGTADSLPPPTDKDRDVPEEVARLTFPCDGPTKEWKVTRDVFVSLQEAFSTVDVVAEIRRAYEWILANPDRRKTAKGMRRFLFNWLSRAVDSRSTSRAPPGPALSDLERRNLEATKLWLAQKEQRHAN